MCSIFVFALSLSIYILLLKLAAKSLNLLFCWKKPANAVIQLQYFVFNKKNVEDEKQRKKLRNQSCLLAFNSRIS